MNAPILDNVQKAAILECARHCERALSRVAWNEVRDNPEAAADWRERATWWSEQAFRELAA